VSRLPLRRGRHPSSAAALKRHLEAYLLVLPALLVLAAFFFGPALFNVVLSFRKVSLFELGRGGRWAGLQNFTRLLHDPLTWLSLRNTVVWLTLLTVGLRVVVGLAIALLLNSVALQVLRLSSVSRTLVLVPWMVPPVVAVAVWQWLLQGQYGAVNQVLVGLGILHRGIPFLSQVSTVWWGIVVTLVWRELPFVVISFLAGLQSIPVEMHEAALMDGASWLQNLRRVTLPLLRPVISVVTLLVTIWTFNNFLYVWLMTRGGPGNSTEVLATQMYQAAFVDYNLGYGAAIGVFMSLFMLVFAVVYFLAVFNRGARQ
jgi:multiple sugar transport system permease protein